MPVLFVSFTPRFPLVVFCHGCGCIFDESSKFELEIPGDVQSHEPKAQFFVSSPIICMNLSVFVLTVSISFCLLKISVCWVALCIGKRHVLPYLA